MIRIGRPYAMTLPSFDANKDIAQDNPERYL